MNNQLLKCGDVVFVNLPSHNPKGHEQQGTRPAVVVGVPLGDVRYPVVVVVPLTTQFGTGQLNRDQRICVFFIGMKWTFQTPSRIS